MTTKASSTAGVKLQRGDGATPTEAFTTIAEVTDVKGPDEKSPTIDVTSFDSAAKEYINGLKDSGEMTFDMNFVGSDAQQQGLRADMTNRVKRNFKLILNDHATTPTTLTFAAIVTAFPLTLGTDAAVKASCTLQISGAVTWAYAP